jgi:hypothetical protein
VSFAAITLCVASQRVFIVIVVYFVIDSVRKLLDTPTYSYVTGCLVLRCYARLVNLEVHLGIGSRLKYFCSVVVEGAARLLACGCP